jgi:hypothetical protein
LRLRCEWAKTCSFLLLRNQLLVHEQEFFFRAASDCPIEGVAKPANSQEARIDEVCIRQQEPPNKGIKTAMHFLVSIFQCLANCLFGASLAEKSSPRFRRTVEAFSLQSGSFEDHWPGVGWMKVRLMLEEFGGTPRHCPVPLRASNNLRAIPRANFLQPECFLPETSPPSNFRPFFPPPDHSGR